MTTPVSGNPIGVFDSGVGGLTVYRALREALPHENFVYLGDTARLPYGTKSAATVSQYALQAASLLMEHDIKLLVIACNTAASHAMPILLKNFPDLPCIDVITPGAKLAATSTISGQVAVLATEGTVRSGSYVRAIHNHRLDTNVRMQACGLLVALAEEGWCDGVEAEAIVSRYLRELGNGFDTLVLGCTHFPLLYPVLRRLLQPNVKIIDSAATTAAAVKEYLSQNGLFNTQDKGERSRFIVTDLPERFARLAQQFLGKDIVANITVTQQNLTRTPLQETQFNKVIGI